MSDSRFMTGPATETLYVFLPQESGVTQADVDAVFGGGVKLMHPGPPFRGLPINREDAILDEEVEKLDNLPLWNAKDLAVREVQP